MAVKFTIKRIDDKSVIRIFEKAKAAGEEALKNAKNDGVSFHSSSQKISLHYSSELPWEVSTEEIKKSRSAQYAISSVLLRLTVEVPPRNNHQKITETINFKLKRGNNDALVDAFEITTGNSQEGLVGKGEQSSQKAIHTILSKLLQPVAPEDGGLIPTLSNLAEGFNTTYQRLTTELSDAIDAVSLERTVQITEFQEEGRRLRETATAERDKLLEDAQKRTREERQEIEDIRQKLTEEWGKLEISSHKDARRKQFQRLQDDLQAALGEPMADKGLRMTRWAVFGSLCASGIAAGAFAYLTISTQSSSSTETVSMLFPAIRSIVLTFASLASFLGAAAWLRYFYVRELQAQEELRRFRNDMARASWVMDAALEIRKEHNEEIPPEWIAGVTEGLFSANRKETLEEGAQALAALMGLSASASFGSGGATFELNKKGGKKIAAAGKQLD